MKFSVKNLLYALAGMLLLTSCKKEENKVFLEGGTNPVLKTSTSSVPLSFATQDQTALTLRWSNPEYKFNTGASSMDVDYNILIDKTSDFSSPDVKTVSVGSDLEKIFIQSEFNDILLNQLQLPKDVPVKAYIKVEASLGGAALLTSNVIQVTATPYAIPPKVEPPASGNLYIVGDATPGGWPPLTVDASTQKFTMVSPTVFELTIQITGDKGYKFVEIPGEWAQQWSVKTTPVSGDPGTLNGDLVFNGADGKAPLESGTYKIVVDFQRGKYSFTKQ